MVPSSTSNFTPIGATCRPCGAKNLKIGLPAACAVRNAAGDKNDIIMRMGAVRDARMTS